MKTRSPLCRKKKKKKKDDDTIEYYHNGKSMGRAFERIRANMKGMALFPSFSMSEGEKCTYNFGATAFKYPVNGYLPVDMSISHAKAAQYLLGCLDRLLPYYYPNSDVHRSKVTAVPQHLLFLLKACWLACRVPVCRNRERCRGHDLRIPRCGAAR